MKITADKLNEYIRQYVQGHLIQNAKQPLTRFKLGFAYGAGQFAVTPAILDAGKGLGIVDGDGNIDIDALKKATIAGMDAAGGLQIPLLGLTLERPDADKFFTLVETGAMA